ncbi:hypothetical protein CMI37_37115 [Candidatus Pacearchaeota archaeon]|nr:hypothetical protein [Candidatus Pacearchaeota archaeon]|tara:strand:+ start:401 stop:667 length:267 start_codon:yes stop_codon:yes gene_type:complete
MNPLIMKAFTKLLFGKNLKKVGNIALKVVDNAVLGGAVTKTVQDTEESPKGKIPYLEIISSLVPVVLLVAVLAGWIDVSQLKELLKVF